MAKPPRSFMRFVVLAFLLMGAVLPVGCAPAGSAGSGSSVGRDLPGDGGPLDQRLRNIYHPGTTVGTG